MPGDKDIEWIEVPNDKIEWTETEQEKEMNPYLKAALNGAAAVGEFIDSYGGDASTRAAFKSFQDGGSVKDALKAAIEVYGDSKAAPTGKSIVEKSGLIKDRPLDKNWQFPKLGMESTGDVAGLGTEIAMSPWNIAPVASGIRAGAKGLRKASQAIGKSKLYDKSKDLLAKAGNTISGAEPGAIKTYMERKPDVKTLYEMSGKSIGEGADMLRESWKKDIQLAKDKYGGIVENAVAEQMAKDTIPKKYPINLITNELDIGKKGLSDIFEKDAIYTIDDINNKIIEASKYSGGDKPMLQRKIDILNLHKLKQHLQEVGKSSYIKDGKIFANTNQAAKISQSAARQARILFNELLPEAAHANKQFEKLYKLEGKLNPNLLKEGKTEASIVAAGSGAHEQNKRLLTELSEVAGQKKRFIRDAELLAAAKEFMEAPWLAKEGTGKAMLRGALGYFGAKALGIPERYAGLPALLVSSPKGVKLAIDLGLMGQDVANRVLTALENVKRGHVAVGMGLGRGLQAIRREGDGGIMNHPAIADLLKNKVPDNYAYSLLGVFFGDYKNDLFNAYKRGPLYFKSKLRSLSNDPKFVKTYGN